jgi:hypothetical protein
MKPTFSIPYILNPEPLPIFNAREPFQGDNQGITAEPLPCTSVTIPHQQVDKRIQIVVEELYAKNEPREQASKKQRKKQILQKGETCWIRWNLDPKKSDIWSSHVLHRMEELIDNFFKSSQINWEKIAQDLNKEFGAYYNTRNCMQRYNLTKAHCFWTPNEEAQLIQLVSLFGINQWSDIAQCIEGKTKEECHIHWYKLQNSGRWVAKKRLNETSIATERPKKRAKTLN